MEPHERLLASVSRETRERLDVYVHLLRKWNKTINLISRSTMDDVWHRHIADSLQLADLIDFHPESWLDLGSGGGLPGLIVAAKLKEDSERTHVTLIESDQRKCAFLSTAAIDMDLDVTIECRRIEESGGQTYDVISARALTVLSNLMTLSNPYRHESTICIFPKGAGAQEELNAAQEDWNITYDLVKSRTDPTATILRLQEFSRVSG